MEVLGLVAGEGDVPHDGVLGDADQAGGGADAAALADMLEDGDGLLGGQLAALQGGALALGVGSLADAAVDHADELVAAAPAAEINVAPAALPVVGAAFIVTEAILDRQ